MAHPHPAPARFCGDMLDATAATQDPGGTLGMRRDGVSRLSAYHHYGMISPFKISRDLLLTRSNGASKYLDEFFTWREVAHAFCFRSWPELESTRVRRPRLPPHRRNTPSKMHATCLPALPFLTRGQLVADCNGLCWLERHIAATQDVACNVATGTHALVSESTTGIKRPATATSWRASCRRAEVFCETRVRARRRRRCPTGRSRRWSAMRATRGT